MAASELAGFEVEVRAGGGVVRRRGPDGSRDRVVHRPRYDDWTLPKGKANDGESDEASALREVREETGLRCELGPEVAEVRYRDHLGPAQGGALLADVSGRRRVRPQRRGGPAALGLAGRGDGGAHVRPRPRRGAPGGRVRRARSIWCATRRRATARHGPRTTGCARSARRGGSRPRGSSSCSTAGASTGCSRARTTDACRRSGRSRSRGTCRVEETELLAEGAALREAMALPPGRRAARSC